MMPNQEGMECWVDAAQASEWNNKTTSGDPSSGPKHLTSKMQMEIVLSTTEAEYIALSQSRREV